MKIVENRATFKRENNSSVEKGLYMVVQQNPNGAFCLMNSKGQVGWLSVTEMNATFFNANHFQINAFLEEMKINLYAKARG